jgi:hypothetical protein
MRNQRMMARTIYETLWSITPVRCIIRVSVHYAKKCNTKSVLTNHTTFSTAITWKRSNRDYFRALQAFLQENPYSFIHARNFNFNSAGRQTYDFIYGARKASNLSFLPTTQRTKFMRSYSDFNITIFVLKHISSFLEPEIPKITQAVRMWPLEFSPSARNLLSIFQNNESR